MDTWVWIVIVVVVIAVVAALVVAGSRRRTTERHRVAAQEIRQDAGGQTASLQEADRQAALADEEARAAQERVARAQAEADRARREAAEAARARDMELATHEDRIREADRLDPDVDHRDPAYVPETAEPAGRHVDPASGVAPSTASTNGPAQGGTAATNAATHRDDAASGGQHAATPAGQHAGEPTSPADDQPLFDTQTGEPLRPESQGSASQGGGVQEPEPQEPGTSRPAPNTAPHRTPPPPR